MLDGGGGTAGNLLFLQIERTTTRILKKLRLAHKLEHRLLSASIKVEFSAIEHHLQPPYMRVAAQNLAAMLIPITLLPVL